MSELSPKNYRRVALINFLMSLPLFGLFSWIGFALLYQLYPHLLSALLGALFLGLAMMLTMLHGHVTVALGVTHRELYYQWLNQRGNKLGLFFFPIFTSTRFRLSGLGMYSIWILITAAYALFAS